MAEVWPKNMPRSLDYPKVGADAMVAGSARRYPGRTALRDGDRSLTFSELHEHVLRFAGGLRSRGIGPGDIVVLHMPNSLWFPVAYYGVLSAGAAAAPINPVQPAGMVRKQLADLGATAVVSHPSCAARLSEAGTEALRLTVCVDPTPAAPAGAEATIPPHAVPLADLLAAEPLTGFEASPDAVAHLQLTGGTTGVPKGVRILHRNLVAVTAQGAAWRAGHLTCLDQRGGLCLEPVPGAAEDFPLRPGDAAALVVAPMFHSLALCGQAFNTLIGATVVIGGRFDPQSYLADIERHRVTHVSGTPAFYHALLRTPDLHSYDVSSVRLLSSGGAPMDTTTAALLRETFINAVFIEGYGLSEATATLASTVANKGVECPPGAVGVPLFDTEIQIRAADGETVLAPGESGEIWARGPQITDGYHGDPGLTAKQLRDGWLRTGDVGYIGEKGCLFLAGRAKDVIIYKGYNVYPQLLEQVLCSHPAVAQASVVGEQREDVGEIPVAFVVLHPGVEAGVGLPEELLAFVAERVAPYQRARALHIVDALPLSAAGKVLKTELRARLAGTG